MAEKKKGNQSFAFLQPPVLRSWATVVGPKEGKGPLGQCFDMVLDSSIQGEKSWEKSEQKMMQHSMELALQKAGLLPGDLDYYFAGDLLNQIICSNFTARTLNVPFFGIYGACSTLAEGLILASLLLEGGYADRVGVSAGSHHDSAERQLRYPTEMAVQRPMTAQWTVTGSGSYILENSGQGVKFPCATVGKVVDLGSSNANDMGSAMAPAAFDTIKAHFEDMGRQPEDYDLIVTGDLGCLGFEMLRDMMKKEGWNTENLSDCGMLIFNKEQDTHCGGSGCGCSAVVFGGFLLKEILKEKYKKVFLLGTGALLSPTASLQGETIPSIAHGIVCEKT